jgi:hypothetical protein
MTLAQYAVLVDDPDAAPLPTAPRGKVSGLDVFKGRR